MDSQDVRHSKISARRTATLRGWCERFVTPTSTRMATIVSQYRLYLAQAGAKHPDAKPLKVFGGAGVLEAIDEHAGDTYRAVYTVRFPNAIYVLHAFQK